MILGRFWVGYWEGVRGGALPLISDQKKRPEHGLETAHPGPFGENGITPCFVQERAGSIPAGSTTFISESQWLGELVHGLVHE